MTIAYLPVLAIVVLVVVCAVVVIKHGVQLKVEITGPPRVIERHFHRHVHYHEAEQRYVNVNVTNRYEINHQHTVDQSHVEATSPRRRMGVIARAVLPSPPAHPPIARALIEPSHDHNEAR